LPHFQPVWLPVALGASHRRPEIFHPQQWYLARTIKR
jgi:hypothetical protein